MSSIRINNNWNDQKNGDHKSTMPLSEGIFPECFKTAKIIRIFKSGDSNSTVNYRPISMLPFLSKIFEKLMCARLDSYQKYNILCPNQFVFLKNSNTSDAIIEFHDYAYSSLDSRQSTIAAYLDFSKVFDTVNQNKLMSKLLHNCVRVVLQHWFESYLSNRKQYVSIKNCSSSMSNNTLVLYKEQCWARYFSFVYQWHELILKSDAFCSFCWWYNSFCIRQWH